MGALSKLGFILDEVSKHDRIISEATISPLIKKTINDIINKKKSDTFTIGKMEVLVKAGSHDITFTYTGTEADTLTYTLTDIADARGLDSNYKKNGNDKIFKMIM